MLNRPSILSLMIEHGAILWYHRGESSRDRCRTVLFSVTACRGSRA